MSTINYGTVMSTINDGTDMSTINYGTEMSSINYDNGVNLVMFCSCSDDRLNLEGVIKQHNSRVVTKKDEPYCIVIRRESLLDDGLATICNKPHDRPLHVTFSDEPGVDQGGICREFFSLALKKVSQSSTLMDGEVNRRVLRHNAIAVQVCFIVSLYLDFLNACINWSCWHVQLSVRGGWSPLIRHLRSQIKKVLSNQS